MAIAKRSASLLQQPVKQLKLKVSIVIQRLQKILRLNTRPRLKGQAHTLKLVYSASPQKPRIIMLSTGYGKSLLFFLVTALLSH
jgi:superfamily II DNA helicase RecQ